MDEKSSASALKKKQEGLLMTLMERCSAKQRCAKIIGC